jgi:hypothetical protein
VFADVLHLLKLIRNHFIDQGFTIDGKYINKAGIEELIAASSDNNVNTREQTLESKTGGSNFIQYCRKDSRMVRNAISF